MKLITTLLITLVLLGCQTTQHKKTEQIPTENSKPYPYLITTVNGLRRASINASTRIYQHAFYLGLITRKLEKTGHKIFTDDKNLNLYGPVILHIAINADGELQRARVLKTSGHKILDELAIKIAQQASPFPPFPEDLRKEVDILDIVKTILFTPKKREQVLE